ncbi:hypothetical protein Trydic_g16973 [Trypoxylus dichotomus]
MQNADFECGHAACRLPKTVWKQLPTKAHLQSSYVTMDLYCEKILNSDINLMPFGEISMPCVLGGIIARRVRGACISSFIVNLERLASARRRRE